MKLVNDQDKPSSQQNTFAPGGTIDTTGFFDDTSQGLDYLTNFLSAPPQMHLDFGEIHFIHRASEDSGYVSSANMGVDRDNIVYFEAERVKMELKELRNENEELKLKIARLFAMTNEIECNQDSLSQENRDLRLHIEDLHQQLEATRLNLQQATEQLAEYSLSAVEEPTNIAVEPEPEMEPEAAEPAIAPTPETSDDVIELIEEMEAPHTEELQAAAPEITEEIPTPPETAPREILIETAPTADTATIVQEPETSNRECSGVAPDTAIISRIMAVGDEQKEKKPKAPAVFSSKSTIFSTAAHKARATSKIIKPEQAKKHQSNHQPVVPLITTVKDPTETVATAPKVEPPKPVFAPPPLIELPENEPTTEEKTEKNTQNLVGVDEIDMEVGPTPKVAIKQQVKMYKTIQEEADTAERENTRHTIEL